MRKWNKDFGNFDSSYCTLLLSLSFILSTAFSMRKGKVGNLPNYINIIVERELHKRSTVQLQRRITSSSFFVRRVWSNSKFKKTRGFLGRDKELRYVYRLVMVLRLSGVQFIPKWYERWQNWTTAQRESDLFNTSIISDLIGRHEVLSPINHKNYNYREKEYGQVMKERKNLHKQSDTSVLKDIAKKPTIQESVNRCYDDWNQGCDWLI